MSRREIKQLPLIIFITFIPMWLVPVIALLFFPAISPFESFALGVAATIVIANIYWATRIAGRFIRHLAILMASFGFLVIVLLILVFKLLY